MALRHLPPFYLYTYSTLKACKKYTYSILKVCKKYTYSIFVVKLYRLQVPASRSRYENSLNLICAFSPKNY